VLTLGINSAWHDSSVALVDDGRVLFAAGEERFSRVKHDSGFPGLALSAALRHAGASIADVDEIGFGWNRPGVGESWILAATAARRIPFDYRVVGAHVALLGRALYTGDGLRHLKRDFGPIAAPVRYIDHHEAHAWSTYGLCGADDAAVLVVDGHGAWQATSIYLGEGNRLKRLKVFTYPNSIGSFYTAFTDLLGFESNSDEWKLMGLAAYGAPTYDLSEIITVESDGYRINANALRVTPHGPPFLQSRFGARRNPDEGFTSDDRNLAASVQQATEEAMVALASLAVRLTGRRRLCLAGGVAMNSKANGAILAAGVVDELFVQPAATDDGTAIGAAIALQKRSTKPPRNGLMTHAYLGPDYSSTTIRSVLEDSRVPFVQIADVERLAASLLAGGHVLGWFQGRMEFGPRALGARSIIADPRWLEMRDRVNASVKFREEWRPFAPACLAERASEFFEPAHSSPFMILTFTVKEEKREVIPAVTHIDHSARVQTVTEDANPSYWGLINEFDRLTGVPVVLNTSFNLKGEPIVCTPQDALRTFFTSGLDFLVIEDFVVPKHDVREVLDNAIDAITSGAEETV
jgi:carbamoyltransferase